MSSKNIIIYTYLLIFPLTISPLESLNKSTLNKLSNTVAWGSSYFTLGATYYMMFNKLTSYYSYQLQQANNRSLPTAKIPPSALSLLTVLPLATVIHYYTAKPLHNLVFLLLTGKKLTPEQCEQCIKDAIEYALYIQILNTLRIEINEVINTINVTHYQTFSSRPEILDEIFAQLTHHEVMSDFNKLFDIHSNLLLDIVAEIYLIVDSQKITSFHIAPLQDITHALKKGEKESYEKLIAYLRTNNHLGLYHILHDIYSQLKIVKAGLQQGINVNQASHLLHKTLIDFLNHWPEIAYPLYEKVEKSLKEYYHLQTLENLVAALRSFKN